MALLSFTRAEMRTKDLSRSKCSLLKIFSHSNLRHSIVLVHGLGGHPIDTWTYTPPTLSAGGLRRTLGFPKKHPGEPENSGDTSIFWPADLLPLSIKNARILTYGYDSNPVHFLSSVNRTNIYQHATNLLQNLSDERLEDVSFFSCQFLSLLTRSSPIDLSSSWHIA